jgi:hypothetical protein
LLHNPFVWLTLPAMCAAAVARTVIAVVGLKGKQPLNSQWSMRLKRRGLCCFETSRNRLRQVPRFQPAVTVTPDLLPDNYLQQLNR